MSVAAIHVSLKGAGAPIVFLHGLGSMGAEIIAPFEPLARRFTLVAPDRPGYGTSDFDAGDTTEWFANFLRARHIRFPIIVAHSIGSMVALREALDHPADVAGIVLIAPFCRATTPARMPLLRLAVAPIVGGFVRRQLIPRVLHHLAEPRIAAMFAPEPVSPSFSSVPLELAVRPDAPLSMARDLNAFNAEAGVLATRIGQLSVPMTIIAGTADRIADVDRHGAWLARRAPNTSLIELEGAGHMLHHTRTPVVIAAIRRMSAAVAKNEPKAATKRSVYVPTHGPSLVSPLPQQG
jgi:pimeloyl-ACP methyl ester carboxylesterase